MTPQQKANWIRRAFSFLLIGGAAAGGLLFAMPDGWWERLGKGAKDGTPQVTEENIAAIQASPGKLTVTNMMLDGDSNSELLKKVLEQLKEEKYGDKITVVELDATARPELAASQGVKPEDFAGHLDFHANGKKLADLLGHTDRETVEKTIDHLLAGLVQRIHKDWLPEVPGMSRGKDPVILEIKPAAAAN